MRAPPPPAIDENGRIYMLEEWGYVHAIEADGSPVWRVPLNASAQATIGPDGTIYAGSNLLYAVAPDGTERWRNGTDLPYFECPVTIAAGGESYICGAWWDFPYRVTALDAGGTLRWHLMVFGVGAPAIGADGTVYVPTPYGLVALADSTAPASSGWPMMQHDARHSSWASGR